LAMKLYHHFYFYPHYLVLIGSMNGFKSFVV